MTRAKKRARRWILRGLLVVLLLVVGAAAAGALWFRTNILADLPAVDSLDSWRPATACQILSADGEPLDRFYVERRIWVPIDELPDHVVETFVASEDRRFWEHDGVDYAGILRAVFANWKAGRTVQGGSTITQQVVKNSLVGNQRSYVRKLKEAVLARRLEQRLGKRRILELYLNLIALGSGNYGVEAASQDYFGRSARELDLGQAALLAGLVPAPSRWSPWANPEGAARRREVVLRTLVREGLSTPQAAALFLDEPVAVPRVGGKAIPAAAYVTVVRREVRRLFGDEDAATRGLVVHSAVDSKVQAVAEQAIRDALDAHAARKPGSPGAEGAAVALENATGRVVAVVGGRESTLEGFVRAVRGTRQPGSSFKPYVYGSALMGGMTQLTTVVDGPLALPAGGGAVWSPKNYGGGYAGAVSLRSAMARSLNTVAVRLILDRTPREVARLARAMGVRTPLRVDPTIALGSSEVTPLDQALGYATIARMGVPTEPVWIDAVEDAQGGVLGKAGDAVEMGDHTVKLPGGPLERALPAGVAYELADMMRAVVESGTARRAWDPRFDRAGKTGTTNGFQDAWFVGFTPRWTVAVWVGADGTGSLGDGETGGKVALPAWLTIVAALGEEEGERLPVPPEAVLWKHEGRWLGFDRANPPKGVEVGSGPLPEW